MAKAVRQRGAGGRVTLKPCPVRSDDQYCGPLNHITMANGREYWACSCGRRYSPSAYKRYLKDNRGFEPR